MASGIQLLMKTMGVDPEKLMADAMQQFAVIAEAVKAGEARIAALDASHAGLHAKLDAIIAQLGIAAPHSALAMLANDSTPAPYTGVAKLNGATPHG